MSGTATVTVGDKMGEIPVILIEAQVGEYTGDIVRIEEISI